MKFQLSFKTPDVLDQLQEIENEEEREAAFFRSCAIRPFGKTDVSRDAVSTQIKTSIKH